MASSFASRFENNWARLRFVGEAELPTRDFVGRELLFKSNLVCAKDLYSFIALPNRREFELCFYQESTLRRFLELYDVDKHTDKWKDWSIESSVNIGSVNVVVKFWTGRVSDHDVELYLQRYVHIKEKPYKPVDQFGIWYGVRKYKVELKRGPNNQHVTLPSSVSLGPYNGRIFYPGQQTRCFVCNSTEHQVRACTEVKCWKCGSLGHKAKECANDAECSLCGERGHSFFQCPQSYSNKARAERKERAEEQQSRVMGLLRRSRPPPADVSTSAPLSADSGQSRIALPEPALLLIPGEEIVPGEEAGSICEEEVRTTEPALLVIPGEKSVPGEEAGSTCMEEERTTEPTQRLAAGKATAAGVRKQAAPSRGRGRGNGSFAAANMRAAAERSRGAAARMDRQQPSRLPEVVAAEETEQAYRELEKAVNTMLPSWSESSDMGDEEEIEAGQRQEERDGESEYDSASEEPSSSNESVIECSGTDTSSDFHVSVNQKRLTSPLVNDVDKKHRKE